MTSTLQEKVYPLYSNTPPVLSEMMQAQIGMLQALVDTYAELNLVDATKIVLSVIGSGQQPQLAINTAAVNLKWQAASQGLVIHDTDANIIAQAITNTVLESVQKAVNAPQQVEPVAQAA